MMHLRISISQRTLIDFLLTWWDVQGRIFVEKVHRLQAHLQNFARHDWEVFDPRHVVNTKLHPDDDIFVFDVVFAISPCSDACATTGLICVPTACIKFSVLVLGHVDIVVSELSALEMEAVWVSEDLLEWWHVNLIRNWLAIDWIVDGRVLDLESAIRIDVKVEACRLFNDCLLHVVAGSMRVPVLVDGVGARLVVNQSVCMSFQHRVYS